jgi:hypothetical protein
MANPISLAFPVAVPGPSDEGIDPWLPIGRLSVLDFPGTADEAAGVDCLEKHRDIPIPKLKAHTRVRRDPVVLRPFETYSSPDLTVKILRGLFPPA